MEGLEARQLLTLMIHYPMDEASGDVVVDVANTPDQDFDQNGTMGSGTSRTAGRIGSGAIQFDGTGTVDIPGETAQYLGEGAFEGGSLAFWIKTTQVGTTSHLTAPAVTGIENADDETDAIWGWIDNTGRIGLTVSGAVPTGGSATIKSTSPINNGNWQHIVFTRDAGTGEMKLYVNGLLQETENGPVGAKTAFFRELGAARVRGENNYLTGTLDEVRVYNHVLDAAEAGAAFNPSGTVPAQPSNLTAGAVGARGVVLNWTSTADNESGFRILRSDDGTFTEVGTVGIGTTTFTAKGLTPETAYTFRVIAFNPTGDSAPSNDLTVTTTVADGAVDNGTGLTGIYYDEGGVREPNNGPVVEESNFKGKIVIRHDATVNFDWGSGSPVAGIASDNFSTRWLGSVKPQYSENYTFYTETDDGGWLYIDLNGDGDFEDASELLIDDPTFHGMSGNERSSEALVPGGVALTAGQNYNIRFEQFEGGGGAGARLRWDSISTAKDIIPTSQLFPLQQALPTGAPSGLAANATGPFAVELTWDDSAVQGEIGYKVERRASDESDFIQVAQVAAGTSYTDSSAAPGKSYTYRLRAFNVAGDATTTSNTATASTTALPSGPGLLGTYHDDKLLSGAPEFVRVDATTSVTGSVGPVQWPDLDNNPSGNNLGTGVSAIDDGNNFSVRWEGTFTPPTTGDYTFFTRTDDAVRLYVNGELLTAGPNVNDFNAGRGATEDRSRAVSLTAGTAYPILMEYNQGTGGATAELRWQGPGIAKGFLPTTFDGQTILSANVSAPTAPTELSGTPGSVSASLDWTDLARNEWANVIELSEDGGASWGAAATTRPANAPSAVSNPDGAAGDGSVLVSGLAPETTYSFRVRTINTAGESYSNVFTLTTTALPATQGSVTPSAGETNLTAEGNLDWSHWGYDNDAAARNAKIPSDYFAFEAEDLSLIAAITDPDGDGKTWEVIDAATDSAANGPATTPSNGKALVSREDAAPVQNDAGFVVYNVTFTSPGSYRLFIRSRHYDIDNGGSLGNNDSARQPTALNRAPGASGFSDFDNGNSQSGNYRWARGNTFNVTEPGTYTLAIGNREGGYMMDRIVLHQNGALSDAQLNQITNIGEMRTAGPISQVTNIGTGTVTAVSTPTKTFSWTDGTPIETVTGTDDAIAVSGTGNGFSFTVPATQRERQLKVYVAVGNNASGQLTATIGDDSMSPFVGTLTSNNEGVKTAVFTIDYKAELPNQLLTIEWVAQNDNGPIMLSAASWIETEMPAAPTNLTAEAVEGGGITLNWEDNATIETGYVIERKGATGEFEEIGTAGANATSFADNDPALVPNAQYTYRVRAAGVVGNSDPSNEASATQDVPLAPVHFTIGTSATGSPTLFWAPVNRASEYVVQRSTTKGGGYSTVATVAETTYTDAAATQGNTYYYIVSPVSQGVQGDSSPERTAANQETEAVVNINFTVDGGDPVAGYVQDIGLAFGDVDVDGDGTPDHQFGWVLNGVPTANPENRNRNSANSGGDERLDSLNHLQKGGERPDTWEIAVPNGLYRITLSGGDPDHDDNTIGLTAEGVLGAYHPGYADATTANRFAQGVNDQELSIDVEVTDGRLTISNAAFAVNNKINYIDIQRILEAPTNDIVLTGTAGNDNWHLKRNGDQIEVRNNADGSGTPVSSHPLGSDFTLNGLGGDDTATVDMSGGDIQLGSFTIQGDAGNDRVVLVNEGVLTLGGVPTLNGEHLDLGTSDLLLPAVQASAVEALLKSARDGETRWQGPGIGTSAAGEFTGLAPVQQGANTLVKFTYNGDANGDGVINADDYFRIDSNFIEQPANPLYAQGDFNFDDQINADDYFLIDSAFIGQGAPLSGGSSVTAASTPTAATAATAAVVVAEEEDEKKSSTRGRGSDGDSLFSSKRIEKRSARGRR